MQESPTTRLNLEIKSARTGFLKMYCRLSERFFFRSETCDSWLCPHQSGTFANRPRETGSVCMATTQESGFGSPVRLSTPCHRWLGSPICFTTREIFTQPISKVVWCYLNETHVDLMILSVWFLLREMGQNWCFLLTFSFISFRHSMQQQTNKTITSTSQLIKQLSDIISGSSRVVCRTFPPFIPRNLPG